jgi:mono/diheme cytochrome c family protein
MKYAAFLVATLFVGSVHAQEDGARSAQPSKQEVVSAGEMFTASCTTCHQVPDLRFDVDRAWLKQVADTA